MTVLDGLYRLTWSGTLGSAEDEIFSYTRHAGTEAAASDAILSDIADSASTDVTDLLAESTTGGVAFTTIGQAFPNTVKWTLLKVYIINPTTGTAPGEPEVRVLTNVGSATGVPFLTNQDALAITTQTAGRDAKSRNRFYLPTMIAGVLASTGHVRGTFVDDIQTQLKLENTAHKAEATPWEYCNYSPTSHAYLSFDRYYSGDVMDTIRRRRNKLVESRHILAA